MKIARTSRLNVLMPGLILALLLFSASTSKIDQTSGTFPSLVPSATAQELPRASSFQEFTLEATKSKSVLATTTAGSKSLMKVGFAGIFTEFSLIKDARPQLMAVAPDGSIFYAQGGSNKIGHILLPALADSGKLTIRDFSIPTADSFPEGILVAPDGVVWFTEQSGNKIGKLDPESNIITEYPTPTANSGPVGITVGPDNNIWFTEAYANKIGKLDPNHPDRIEEFNIPTPVSAAIYIMSGPDAALWYVGVRSHKLGRFDIGTHAFVEYPMLTPNAGPTSLVLGSDGAIWVSEFGVDKIARFDMKIGKFTDEISIVSHKNGARSGPGILINGPDGNIWFTETFGNQIAMINPINKQVYEFTAPVAPKQDGSTLSSGDTAKQALVEAQVHLKAGEEIGPTGGPGGIVFSLDGTVWYSAMFTNKIARLKFK
jgi:virginiamycin B lyase